DWLRVTFEGDRGVRGNCDLRAVFFRRVTSLVGAHGTIGLLATNTSAQGDTRRTGLKHLLVEETAMIYEGTRSMTWPGEAAVTAAAVHLAKGRPPGHAGQLRLDGWTVPAINSRLRPIPERPDAQALANNAGCSFQGSVVLGMGFVL